MRYDPIRGVYRDCKWCEGKGCLSCSVEAERAYKREFPDGPKPIATFVIDQSRPDESLQEIVGEIVGKLLGPAAIEAAGKLADDRARAFIDGEQGYLLTKEAQALLPEALFPAAWAEQVENAER